MNEQLNGGGLCRAFENFRTSCLFAVDKLGTMAVTAALDPCKRPAELDLATETPAGRVLSSFVAGNQLEWRQIGPEYWPLGLSVRFQRTTEDTFSVKACLDTMRTGVITCFLDQNVTRPVQCSYSSSGTHSIVSVAVICVLLAAVFLTLVISVATLTRRYALHKRRRKHGHHHKQKIASSLPTLPSAKPYGHAISSDSKGALLAVIEEDEETDTSRALLLIEDGLSSHDDSKRSKEVQTSANSLNTSGLGSAGSSSSDHDKSSSPYGVVLESPL